MRPDPREEAKEYLDKHKLPELFEYLSASVGFNRPENPREFLQELLVKCEQARDSGQSLPPIFSAVDVQAMFGMFDITGCGHVSATQLKQALSNVGCPGFEFELKDRYELESFQKIMLDALSSKALSLPKP